MLVVWKFYFLSDAQLFSVDKKHGNIIMKIMFYDVPLLPTFEVYNEFIIGR